jgi:hypothetical protein
MASKKAGYPWAFRARFRANAFGWKSQPAITRVREAVAEIKRVARSDPMVAADGAVLFLERVSPALTHVDSSSGAIGSAVNRAIQDLVGVIVAAPADVKTREGWLERLYEARAADDIPRRREAHDRAARSTCAPRHRHRDEGEELQNEKESP